MPYKKCTFKSIIKAFLLGKTVGNKREGFMMRVNEKQWQSTIQQQLNGVDFHRFMEIEGESSPLEIAQEFGITLGEVKRLKRKVTRT